MEKKEYRVSWWIEIYPFGYDRDCELRNIELMGTVLAEDEEGDQGHAQRTDEEDA